MINNEFSNDSVATENFPALLDLDNRTLAAEYAPVNRMIGLVVTLIISLVLCSIYFQPLITLPNDLKNTLPILLWVIVPLGLLLVVFKSAADKCKRYSLRSLDLHYSSGLFFCKTVSQPITRIQHIELKRGPIERKIGLATLQVFSAGGAMHTFEIPGLPFETAQHIRQFILEHKDMAKHG